MDYLVSVISGRKWKCIWKPLENAWGFELLKMEENVSVLIGYNTLWSTTPVNVQRIIGIKKIGNKRARQVFFYNP